MTVSLCGSCCHACAATSLFVLLVTIVLVTQVCLNKVPSPFYLADLSPSPLMSLLLHLRDPPATDPPPSPLRSVTVPSKQPWFLQIRAYLDTNATGQDLQSSSPPGIRHRASSLAADDEFLTYSSVIRCVFHLRLRHPFFNRSMVRSFHSGVSAVDASTAHRRRAHHLCFRHDGFCVHLVFGPFCNMAFFEGLVCKMVA